MNETTIDPYRILFPLGLMHAIVGSSYWIFFMFSILPYPGVHHAQEMFTGFLLSYAVGFLLTAVPRFTGSKKCTVFELSIGTLLSLLTFFTHAPWVTLCMLVFLTSFFIKRFRSGNFDLPPYFIFVPTGLGLGIIGSSYLTITTLTHTGGEYTLGAHLILYTGTMLSLLLGIGAKLIAALLGWAPLPLHQIESVGTGKALTKKMNWKRGVPFLLAALFVSSFVFEILIDVRLGKVIRAACVTWIGIQNWHIYRRPAATGKLAFWLWIGACLLILGLWTQALFPSLGVHAAHLIFVMGFALSTFMVASRVTLAHGGYPLECESKSHIYAIVCISLIVAGVTRFYAYASQNYTHHLGYAAAVFLIAAIAWGSYFLPKIIFRQNK